MKRIRYTATDVFKKRKVMQLLTEMEFPELRADEVIYYFFEHYFPKEYDVRKMFSISKDHRKNLVSIFKDQLFPGLSHNNWSVLLKQYENKVKERIVLKYQIDTLPKNRLLPLAIPEYRKLSSKSEKWFRTVEDVYAKAYV